MKKLLILLTGIAIGFAACKKSAASKTDSDRKITITVDNNTPATGANVTFTLTAGNDGPAASTGIVVSNMLPAGYTFVSASATTGSYAAGAWSGFGLTSGGSATLTIIATVNPTGNYTNTATIAGIENDPVAGNNSSSVTTTPTAPKGLMVSTLAGSDAGYADGTGAAARFYNPRGLTVDAAGNVYIADYSNSRIRKITSAGIVTTLVGDASVTGFYQPLGVGVDAAGNVYVADANNNRIRKITPGGVVTTLAGSADGGVGSAGYVDGMGTSARFSTPNGVAIDASGNVYVTDAGNYLIRKITPAGLVSTLAGSVEGYADGT